VAVPIIAGGSLFLLLGLFLVLFMPEHGFTPRVRQVAPSTGPTIAENWKSMLVTFRAGLQLVRGKPALVMILSIGLFYGLYSEGFDRLWTPHLIQDITLPDAGGLSTVIWFGFINVVAQLLSLGSAEAARRMLDPDNPRVALWTLFTNSAVLVFGLVIFALTRNFALALGSYWMISICRRLIGPYHTAWVNRHLTSNVRATVLSMSSQVDALGQIAGGPILGVIGNALSIPAALLGSAILLSPVLGLLVKAMRKEQGMGERMESREA